MSKDNKKQQRQTEMEEQIIYGQPETAQELVHKYGTYEIQPTLDSDNEFPKIGAGLPTETAKKQRDDA